MSVANVTIEDRARIQPGRVPEFFAALEAALPRIEALGVRCRGVFHTVGATGCWNEVFAYWDLDDWAHYGRVMARWDGPGSLCDLADPEWALRAGGSSVTLHPSKHCPALAELVQAGVQGRVFLHEYIRPLPGKREAYVRHYVENYLEATRKAGRELVGLWGLQRSANDVLILLAIPDWETHTTAVATRPDADAEKPWRISAPEVREDYDLRMLVPGPRSLNPLAAPPA
jgi:hypothetical protein